MKLLQNPYILIALIAYLLIVNLIALIQMAVDKQKAKKHVYRIPEKQLFLPVLFGGSIGGLLGIYCFRHKTKHWYFPAGFGACFLIQMILLAILLIRF